MSWLTRAFTTVNNDPESYYATISPIEFYEWRFLQSVPKGARVHVKMPRSDVFTENQVIVSAKLPPSILAEKDGSFEVTEDTPAAVYLTVGQVASPLEVVSKFTKLKDEFSRALSEFKRTTDTQKYFTSINDDPKLYRVKSSTEENVTLQLLGTVDEVREKLNNTLEQLGGKTSDRKWRAHEMETYRKFENYMTMLENSAVPIDATKMEFLLTTAQIDPAQKRTMPWKQCFLEISTDAQDLQTKLQLFNSMKWVQHTMQYMPDHGRYS